MTIRIAMYRTSKEKMWTIAIVGLLTIGVTTWIVVPSISASLQSGLSSYASSVATYVFVYNSGWDNYLSRVPANVTDKVASIPGVQEVYPIVTNYTFFIGSKIEWILADGTRLNMTGAIEGHKSAVIGGQVGFPESLISLSKGRFPGIEAEFLINGAAASTLTISETRTVGFSIASNTGISDDKFFRDSYGNEYIHFNATAVGQMPYNPMLQQVDVLWNSTFLENELGTQLFNQTFGGEGTNYVIVKAQSIEEVEQIAHEVQSMFVNYPGYSVIYDEATVQTLLSFQSGSQTLYDLIGVASLFSVVSIIFVFSYVFSGRRRWEAGLLVTQGWSWHRVNRLFLYYYLVMGVIAGVLSILLSAIISSQITYSFQAYGETLKIPLLVTQGTWASGIAISLIVSTSAACFAVWRMKRMGLDNLLREY